MCDGVIFIILFSFPLSLRLCVTLRLRVSKKLRSHFKETHPSALKFLESLNNILGVGRWSKPNIFPITALFFKEFGWTISSN